MVKIGRIEINKFPLLLAPMEGVTDQAFRKICKPFGVDLMYTEFISSEGLIRDVSRSKEKLLLTEDEHPIGIQIFGNNIESMKEAAILAEQSNPELIDLNFGCSIRKIVQKGCGAGMLNDIPKMVKMTETVVKAVHTPVTVKTRLGWDDKNKNIEEITERLQDVGIQAITIHGRTKAQIYKGVADWTLIGKIKNNQRISIPVFGNGDVTSPEIALEMIEKYHVDGIMIGRAVYGNPWIFREINHYLATKEHLPTPTLQERITVCRQHLTNAIQLYGERYGVLTLRRHYKKYFKGIPDFKTVYTELVTHDDPAAIDFMLSKIK